MTGPFGRAYADVYDAIYRDKDYQTECDLLEISFRAAARPVRSVLDLGCGTGSHSHELSARGYEVVGVDISAPMLDRARQRGQEAGGRATFRQGDIRSVRLNRQFDAVICMFAVLGYQTTDEDVLATFVTARKHLAKGGPFVFDVWYGPAVEEIGPSHRQKVFDGSQGPVVREASASLDLVSHLCTINYRLTHEGTGEPRILAEETHRMRYFFADELGRFLTEAGLSLQRLAPLPDTTAPVTSADWNVLGIAAG